MVEVEFANPEPHGTPMTKTNMDLTELSLLDGINYELAGLASTRDDHS